MTHIIHTCRFLALILTATLAAAVAPCGYARDYTPDELENPNIADRYDYVADPEHSLSQETKGKVNARLRKVRESTTAEVAVAVVPSIGDYTIEDFSEKVFTRWGLGKKDKDNGVLLLISPDSRQVRIQTGYGTEGVLPDITCAYIIDSTVIPNMKNDCLDCAVDEATAMIAEIMENPEYAEELRSKLSDNYGAEAETPISGETVVNFLMIAAGIMWIFALVSYISDRRKTRRIANASDKALVWRGTLTTFAVLAVLTCLTALPFYLLALLHYRRARYGNRRCRNCGGKTTLLKGAEAMGSLTPSQQFEVKLGSAQYDVHKCRKCGTTEVTEFPVRNTPYSKCPHCGTRAYHYIGKEILRQPTYQAEGEGVMRYRCEYCGHSGDKGFRVPKKDMAAAMAAGALLGAASRRNRGGGFGGGFGGGGFGGGFGGGSTGGGGASGRW